MKIKKFLKDKGWTYAHFASLIGVNPQSVWRYIHGARKPSLKVALKIKEITKNQVTLEDLL